MALTFGALSFTKLKDNTIEVTAPGKQHLNYEDTQELINWLRNLSWDNYKHTVMGYPVDRAPNYLSAQRPWGEVAQDAMQQADAQVGQL